MARKNWRGIRRAKKAAKQADLIAKHGARRAARIAALRAKQGHSSLGDLLEKALRKRGGLT